MSKRSFDISEQFQRALASHQQGRLEEAERGYTEILRRAPDHFAALNLLGALACQKREYERAVRLISKAISINSQIAAAHSNIAVALRELRRFEEALESCNKAIALKTDHTEAYYNRGLILKELGHIEDALKSYDKALSLRPDAECYYSRGNALKELDRFEDALASYEKAIFLNPNLTEAHFNRGNALRELDRPQEALACYNKVLALQPAFADAYRNRGGILRDLYKLDESLASYEAAIRLQPNDAELYSDRAVVLSKLGLLSEALESCDRAIRLRPDFADAHYNRGNVLRDFDRLEDACDSFEKAIALKPDFGAAYNNMGLSLHELGRPDKAQEAFHKVIDLDKKSPSAYFNLSHTKKFKPGDSHIDIMAKLLAEPENLSEHDHAELNFALGKAYADLKDYRLSFEHFLLGNKSKRSIMPYDEVAAFGAFDTIERIFDREFVEARSGGGNSSHQPIFIFGMPRSGTTLIEQILASHPEVCGAGETELFRKSAHLISKERGSSASYPHFVPGLDSDAFACIGSRYLSAINEHRPESARITDKMPANFLYTGLIHLALPNAKIIHAIRDPIDNCVSCFSILFQNGQDFTYDLGELGRYYRRYERLMTHWHSVLPRDRMLNVQYEDVVTDIEAQARRILAFCELPWDDRCLSFYKTERAVRTASTTQVRQPIYNNAVGRWRVYEEFLGPLLEALGKTDAIVASA